MRRVDVGVQLIDELLERASRGVSPPGPVPRPALCLVLCTDAGLSGRLEPLAGAAAIIRLPAASGALSEEVLQRAVAKAVFVEGCREVLLVSHEACTLAACSANDLLDALKERGVARSAVPFDIREWVGAGRSPREAVRQSAELLRRCPYLPQGLRVDVAHFDDTTGTLALIDRGQSGGAAIGAAGAQLAGYVEGPTRAFEDAEVAPTPVPTAPVVQVVVSKRPAAPPVPSALKAALRSVSEFIAAKMPAPDRAELWVALERVAAHQGSPHKMADLFVQHLLYVRGSREEVGDGLLVLRKAIHDMSLPQATQVLQGLLKGGRAPERMKPGAPA
jgi:hypothetical protein